MYSQPAKTFNPDDPHGFHADPHHHAGHHITNARTLLVVIVILLVCTGLTVAAAQIESYLILDLGWHIPRWVNVAIAMSIATFKATLVVLFFMALKYDSRLNAIVFLFCLFAFSLFLGLTAMDLVNRGHAYAWKAPQLTPGGTGVALSRTLVDPVTLEPIIDPLSGKPKTESITGSITAFNRERYIAATGITPEEYQRRFEAENHLHGSHDAEWSSASRSVRRTGLSGALDAAAPTPDHADPHADPHTPAEETPATGH